MSRAVFQSTLPLRGVTNTQGQDAGAARISIHTPLAGSDVTVWSWRIFWIFQSTLPLRGVTYWACWLISDTTFQSTLPLRGVTASPSAFFRYTLFQSTLPLRGVTAHRRHRGDDQGFQSTLPLRGVTEGGRSVQGHSNDISIHTPLAGSDLSR